MTIYRMTTGLAALTLAASAVWAQAPADDPAREQARQDAMPDTRGDGPFPALMEVDPALPSHVVYRPADLSRMSPGSLGVFVWGNGGCVDDGASARLHLAQIASYGYLVIAPGKWRSGPNAKEPRVPPAANGLSATRTSVADIRRALDWALAEGARSGSRYAGLIDSTAVAAGGFSCGGVQALDMADDPRLGTVVVQNSGLFSEPAAGIPEMAVPKSALAELHTPVLYLLGGESDIAYANGMDDFARIEHVPAAMINLPVGHGGTYFQPNGGKAARIVVDWLQWRLRGDGEAAKAFAGPDCRWCSDPEVTIERKHFD